KHKILGTTENISAFLDSYVHFLSLELPLREGKLLPGVLELLGKLKSRPHLVLALLTGNVSRGAQLKLEHYGVWHFFEFGAFADDHQDRNRLGRFARTRAKEKHGCEFAASEIDVIGDTPRDIACGKAFGARTIAVATGTWSHDELAKYQPDFLIWQHLSKECKRSKLMAASSRWPACKKRCVRSLKSRGLIRYFRFSQTWTRRWSQPESEFPKSAQHFLRYRTALRTVCLSVSP